MTSRIHDSSNSSYYRGYYKEPRTIIKGVKKLYEVIESKKQDCLNYLHTNDNCADPKTRKNGIRKLNDLFKKESFVNLKNKSRGVEPGFTGQKPWTEKDDDKLFNPANPHHKKYRNKAEAFVRKKLKERQTNFVKDVFSSLGVNKEQDIKAQHFERFFKSLQKHVNEKNAHPKFQEFLHELRTAVKRVYIVKLDYDDPRPGSETVMIPLQRAQAPAILGFMGRIVHQLSTAGTRREKNLGAVLETLANDVYKILQLESQDLCIRKAQYSDGYVKLLLESKFVEGTQGERFDVMSKQIKHGVIPGNKLASPDDGIKADIKHLGRQKIKALFLGDKDKVGRKGDNIGYIVSKGSVREAIMQNIDPGKSLPPKPAISQDDGPQPPKDASKLAAIKYAIEKILFKIRFYLCGITDPMTHQNIHTNFSFDQHLGSMCDGFKIAYDNFSIFDDTLLSEKMEGVREILNNWNKIENLFKEYKAAFSEGEIDFASELESAWQRLQARKLYIEEVFKERLKLTSDELDMLDNIEKLTSKTTDRVGSTMTPIPLTHLKVLPNTRHEWHLTKTPNNALYTLSFRGKDAKEAEKVFQKLEKFCCSQGISLEETDAKRLIHSKMIHRDGNSIEISWTRAELQMYQSSFSENTIAKYQGKTLLK